MNTTTPVLIKYPAISGKEIELDTSDEALSQWEVIHNQYVLTPCGPVVTVAGVAEHEGKPCLWLIHDSGNITPLLEESRSELIDSGYWVVDID